MEITNNRTLKDLQKDFREVFPFLKINFYSTAYQQGKGSDDFYLLDSNLTIGSIRGNINTGDFILEEDMTVSTFEQLIWDLYGLHLRVFRKSNEKWLQTWATDNWTLKDQNQRSLIICTKDNQSLVS